MDRIRLPEFTLALPLALFFLAFFAGPLAVLVIESFTAP
jgi:hypothetical protein